MKSSMCVLFVFKGQMHHRKDLGLKRAFTCHLLNKTSPEPVLFSTTQLYLTEVQQAPVLRQLYRASMHPKMHSVFDTFLAPACVTSA